MRKKRGNNRGFALILTLWVLAILSVLLLTFSQMVRKNIKASSYFAKDVNASLLARGALKRVALELLPKEEPGRNAELAASRGELLGTWFVDPVTWNATKINDTEFKTELDEYVICEITAEDSKLPLNKLTKAIYLKLPAISPVIAEAIATRQKGSPGESPQSPPDVSNNKPESGAPAGSFKTVEELLQVEGVEGPVYDGDKEKPGLKQLLTSYSDGRIFLNGARKEVIRALPGVDDQLALEIANRIKAGKFFEKVEELKQVLGVTPPLYKILAQWFKLTPAYYRIKAKASVNGIPGSAEGVIRISGKDVDVLFLNGG